MRFLNPSVILVFLIATVTSALPLVEIAGSTRLTTRDNQELVLRASRPVAGRVGQRPPSNSHSTHSGGLPRSHSPPAHQQTHAKASRPRSHSPPANRQAHAKASRPRSQSAPPSPQTHAKASSPRSHSPPPNLQAHTRASRPRSNSAPPNLQPHTQASHAALIQEVQQRQHKISAQDVVNIWKTPHPIPGVKSDILFLEKGNTKAGLAHIIHKHKDDFQRKGVAEGQIPHLIEKATTTAGPVGKQGKGTGRPIFKVDHNGQEMHVAVSVGSNGFIVGANPAGDPTKKGGV